MARTPGVAPCGLFFELDLPHRLWGGRGGMVEGLKIVEAGVWRCVADRYHYLLLQLQSTDCYDCNHYSQRGTAGAGDAPINRRLLLLTIAITIPSGALGGLVTLHMVHRKVRSGAGGRTFKR